MEKSVTGWILILLYRFLGYRFVRGDRGALEFVAENDLAREDFPPNVMAMASYRSILWPSEKDMEDQATLKHELSHLEDDRRLGFFVSRFLHSRSDSYFGKENNPFELKAERAAKGR